jgi:hypothetical protein
MTLSEPSLLAAAISVGMPPPSAADVAAAQSPGLTDGDAGDGASVTEGAAAADGEPPPVAGAFEEEEEEEDAEEEEQPTAPSTRTPIPAMSFRDNFINYLT